MSYTVLARRYRSQSFGDVVGQQPIAATIRSAIASGRVAHAYLFCGTRGVGKTSLARIFARALNAPDTIADSPKLPEAGELPPLDVQQRMADAIMRGDDLNVIEIDGASNNSVEQARQLIANAGLSPTANARYKIYIIDEVHMLSNAAFNALLKTMEEPPEHIKFILCTTEPGKVPATIKSRCQRFDFRNIPTAQIAAHLKDVVEQENIDADQDVLWQIARLGNGSMRDALSLLDRLIATIDSGKLSRQTIEQVLGLPDQQVISDLVGALADGDIAESLRKCNELLSRGISQDQFIDVLIEHFRQLMLISACGEDSPLVELFDDAKQAAAKQAARFDPPALVYMIWLCENLVRAAKTSANPRALLDATIVRLALAEKMADVTAILASGAVPAASRVSTGGPKKKPMTAVHEPDHAAPPAGVARQVKPAPTPGKPSVNVDLPDVDISNPAQVWASLQQQLADRPAFGWLDYLRLNRLEDGVAWLSPAPGRRDVAAFAGEESRRKQLASHLTELIGRPVRIRIESDSLEESDAGQPARTTPAANQIDRREAMNLPLVRKVLDVFPDATLISAQKQTGNNHV